MTKRFCLLCMSAVLFCISSFAFIPAPYVKPNYKIKFPYTTLGLTKQQAAAHLLSRFSFGATPNQVAEVAAFGLEKWLEQQLAASLNDDELNEQLKAYDALNLNNAAIQDKYKRADQIIRTAIEKGLINSKESIKADGDKAAYKKQLQLLMAELNLLPIAELNRQLINQKIIRAAYSNNQLKEVLVNFWFNHFNVSLTKNQSQSFVLSYERDAIRPNVLSSFDKLLIATAKHPAMLTYLDNAESVSNDNDVLNTRTRAQFQKRLQRRADALMQDSSNANNTKIWKQLAKAKQQEGLNENFAREVMELHTLGVDGGFTQKDVTEIARSLTGWTISPVLAAYKGKAQQKMIEKYGKDVLTNKGFVFDGDFMFRADKHDSKEKIILGTTFSEGGGLEEGMSVLKMLSNHPSTANFICKKLAVHFVSDTPSNDLIQQMANTFMATNGNIKSILITMANHVDFWKAAISHSKVKSPFELAISVVRATNARVQQPYQIFNWCNKMGQKIYHYQAPTGFPDQSTNWVNSGALINRMNFGLAFATQKIPGIHINWLELNQQHEPESAEQALYIYSDILLPERSKDKNITRLLPLVNSNQLENKVAKAAENKIAAKMEEGEELDMVNSSNGNTVTWAQAKDSLAYNPKMEDHKQHYRMGAPPTLIAQVAGIIIGSPEFQRK
jgi:uncharacterized protein (DUF1800 family)